MLLRCLVASLILHTLILNPAHAQDESNYDSKQRTKRIRELGKANGSAILTLAGYLGDPDRNIRLEATKAIVKIGGEGSVEPLIRVTRDSDAELAIRATDGLVNFYVPGYATHGLTGSFTRGVRQVKSFFNARNDQAVGRDVSVRDDVAQALAQLIGGSASLDARANAARAAGILRAGPAVTALQTGLRSKDTELIFESLVALQKIGDPAAGPSVSFLLNDLNDRVQATALETVGVLVSRSSAPDVRSVLPNARNARVRRAALEALAMFGLASDRPLFQQYESDSDSELRASALEGLGRIREPEDFTILEKAYNEQNAGGAVHLAAAFGMVQQGKVEISELSPLQYLYDTLNSADLHKTATAYLVECSRDQAVRGALISLLPNATKDQKMAICEAFGRAATPDVVPPLETLSRDIDSEVALAAARSLKMTKARQS